MKKFEASFDSLSEYECPEWFMDAKFGIWSIWGPQSVPMCGDWYARNMYIQDSPQYLYHVRNYGHPSKFGYKDLCKLWKAERFDAEYLIKKYYNAGARYFAVMAMHHDHFFNYDSKLNQMNSTKVGPMKDIVGMWRDAARKYNLRFGITEHLSASFSWWFTNKGCDQHGPYKEVPYDGNLSEYRDFYFNNTEHVTKQKLEAPNKNMFDPNGDVIRDWFTTNTKFHQYWFDVVKEIIDRYEPDLLYTDGGLPFGRQVFDDDGANPLDKHNPLYQKGLEAVAYYYNKSIERYGENNFVYTQKDRRKAVYQIGILDIEKSQLPDIRPCPWQTDSCIGGWFYSSTHVYKKPKHIIEMLIDIISKNGVLLLNILQRPDGTIDDEAEYILDELATWFAICGEGVYKTRPWIASGEGSSLVNPAFLNEDAVDWKSDDFRFTQKGDIVYAFMLRAPESRTAVLKSFKQAKIQNVSLMGYGKVSFLHEFGILVIKLPDTLPTAYANCFAIKAQFINH